jgi:hypothetical protein
LISMFASLLLYIIVNKYNIIVSQQCPDLMAAIYAALCQCYGRKKTGALHVLKTCNAPGDALWFSYAIILVIMLARQTRALAVERFGLPCREGRARPA